MILKFENYISELWSKGIERSRSGEKRTEDMTCLDNLCKYAGEFIAKELKIDYSSDLCKYEEDNDYLPNHSEDYKYYYIYFNFGELGDEYSDIVMNFKLIKDKLTDEDFIYRKFAYCLDMFQDSDFDYNDYKDPYIPSKKEFNKIKKILSKLVNHVYKYIE